MKKHFIALVTLLSSIAAIGVSTPASAQVIGQSSIGPSVLFGNGQTSIGIDSKFGVSDNLSLRPFVYFPNNGTSFGTSLTYDLPLRNTEQSFLITPFVGGSVAVNTGNNSVTTFGLVGGADIDLSDSLRLKASVIVPVTDSNQGTGIAVGAGLRF
ncbi:hypothetical protein [Chamaesiphon sp. OTE_8_metabat_110]|uniref:hypothetical protein n=1 Tax=Chamaesiphon sp. OTE_8_metabat_110 TaxID=2964696 RepID=UPI00286CD419|nr:hypothetical protein [Chamaesiphon sp. OTE_8_metabat_110]